MLKKTLSIPYIESAKYFPELSEISVLVDMYGERISINEVNWPDFNYQPEVELGIAYSADEILLKYRVEESQVRAVNTHANSEVYKDSCVEFFISTGSDFFYNFEFNCIGTAYTAYGKRGERELLDSAEVSRIRTFSSLGNDPIPVREAGEPWELTIAIPFGIFREKELAKPGGQYFYANFYKCGDELPRPHFLSWNPIKTGKPDFHQPDFFGKISFLNQTASRSGVK